MKKLFLIALVFYASNLFAQTNSEELHPSVKSYSLLVDEFIKFSKEHPGETFNNLPKMSTTASEINCLLTEEQAKNIIPFFVENQMRKRSCGSEEYPRESTLNQVSIEKYKASMDNLRAPR